MPHRHLLGGEGLPVVVARFSSPPPVLTTRVTRGDGSCRAAAALIDVKVGRVVFRLRRPTARVRLLECEMSRVHPIGYTKVLCISDSRLASTDINDESTTLCVLKNLTL